MSFGNNTPEKSPELGKRRNFESAIKVVQQYKRVESIYFIKKINLC